MGLPPTPSQTVGPFFAFALLPALSADLVAPASEGAIRLQGQLTDGAAEPVCDGLVELWDATTERFGRSGTEDEGRFAFTICKPRAGAGRAPYLSVSVFARGLLARVCTRIYFPDEPAANAADPTLAGLTDASTLVASADGDGLRFDICLQGDRETVFFDV